VARALKDIITFMIIDFTAEVGALSGYSPNFIIAIEQD
jgi:hypothetical protein